jgi:hypothetical protein
MVILSLCFSPLSASLFTVKDTYLDQPAITVDTTTEIGLNQGDTFQDLTGLSIFLETIDAHVIIYTLQPS